MKILYISDAKSIHTKRWANYFHSQGHTVEIASFRFDRDSTVPIHTLKTYGFGKLGYFFAVAQLKSIVNKSKPDIIHAQYITSYGFLSSLANLHPLILTAWGSDILVSPQKSFFSRFLVQYALKRADCVTTVAEHMNEYINKYCATCKDVQAMPFGVDLDLFSLPQFKKQDTKTLKLISTRNFTAIYNIDTLIKAVDILNKKGILISLELVGEGELRGELEALVKKLNLQDIVTFYGHIEQFKIVELLQNADIFITTAISDGNNISLNEAMACGCFPIATNIPANSQWITNNENGFLFEIYNFNELSEVIEKATFIDYNKVILKNRKIVEEKANWKVCVEDMTNKYIKLMELK